MKFEPQKLINQIRAAASALNLRARLKYLIALIACIVSWQVLDYLPNLFFDSKAFQARLEEFLDSSKLAISYQGIDVSLFQGVRIIGVRVSFDRDFSRGRYLLEAPAVYVRIPLGWVTPDRDWLSKARIIIEEGKIGYWVTSDNADQTMLGQVRSVLQEKLQYHVECHDCRFYLNVKDNSYFQEITPVEKLHFTVKHAGKEIQALVRYESSVIGDGDFFGKFAACDTLACDDLQGYWYFKPAGLKMALLNNFQKDFEIASGAASGEIAFDRTLVSRTQQVKGKAAQVREPVSNFRMAMATRDFSVRKEKIDWYRAEAFGIDTKMLIRGSSATGHARATLDGYDVQAEFDDLRADALPEKYVFRVTPRRFGKKVLTLPAQLALTGLNNFSINLSERRGNKYAKTEINLDIADGALQIGEPGKMPPLGLPEVRVDLVNEKLSGVVRLSSGSSDATAALSGGLELYPVQFKPLTSALLRQSKDVEERKIFSLKGTVQAPLTADYLYWTDLKPYVNAWLDDYWREVQNGIQYSWLPSHLKRREYFVRFIQYLDFSMPIEIRNFVWSGQVPLKGSLFFAPMYSGGSFRLATADGQSSTSVSLSMGGDEPNSPYMTHELRLKLDNVYELLLPWFGEDFFEYYSSVDINYINHFNGERPADHYLKSNSATDIRFKRVRLGKWGRQQNLPLQWETVDIRTNRQNGLGAVSSIRAENDNNLLSGFGEYKLFDRQIDANLKYTMIMK